MGALDRVWRWRHMWLSGVVGASILVVVAGCGGTGAAPVARATATLTPTLTHTPTLATVSFQDALTAASHDAGWSTVPGGCTFQSDGFHFQSATMCLAPVKAFANGTVSVQVKQISGPTFQGYMLVFRNSEQPGLYYAFRIDSYGYWRSFKASASGYFYFEEFTASSAIHTGLNASNTMQVVMTGSHFDYFVNGTKVGQDDDSTYPSGTVGLESNPHIEVVFSNMSVRATR